MFQPEHYAAGVGGGEESVFLNGRPAERVDLFSVRFSLEGMRRIGEAILAVAEAYGLPEGLIRKRMAGRLFKAPPSPSLYFLFHMPEVEADMHVEIPPVYWSMRAVGQPASVGSEKRKRLAV